MDATSRPPASARRRPERREIVVVGAGVLGLAAARELAARGHDVLCLEQASVGGSRSGSKGRSRIFRLAYEDPLYVQLAERARPLWRSLENCSGRSLLQETGLLSFGEEIDRVAEAMASAGMPPERLTAAEVADTFPGIVCSGPALFERGAGVLAADEAMAALRETSGAELREGARVESMTLDESKGPEVLAGERRVSCALLVLCGGAWSARLAAMAVPTGAGLGAHLAPTLQQVAYFEHTSGALPA
ncbi:MAG: FAD-dependent oxidoreductase, partial [Acidimicrobiales bacterium]